MDWNERVQITQGHWWCWYLYGSPAMQTWLRLVQTLSAEERQQEKEKPRKGEKMKENGTNDFTTQLTWVKWKNLNSLTFHAIFPKLSLTFYLKTVRFLSLFHFSVVFMWMSILWELYEVLVSVVWMSSVMCDFRSEMEIGEWDDRSHESFVKCLLASSV